MEKRHSKAWFIMVNAWIYHPITIAVFLMARSKRCTENISKHVLRVYKQCSMFNVQQNDRDTRVI